MTTIVFFMQAHGAVLITWVLLKHNACFAQFVSYCTSAKKFKIFAWTFFFITAFSSSNFLAVAKDLFKGNAYKYNQEAYNRYNKIKNAPSDTVFISPYQHWPVFARFAKKEDENSNLFFHMNKYFG